MNAWCQSEIDIIQEMSAAMIAKFDKYWHEIHGLMAIAVILDPRGKLDLLEACYICLFGEDDAEKHVDETKKILVRLMDQYDSENEEGCVTSSSDVGRSSSCSSEVLTIFKTLTVRKKSNSVVRSKNELDRYLEADNLPCVNENFDILGWWKVTGTHYPTLRLIARDIFVVPITTVASESAFSTSVRVLSEHRSRLTPKLLEALMCCQDWLRNQLEGQGKNGSFWTCLEDEEEQELKENCSISTVDLE